MPINPYFLIFECLIYLLFFCAVWHTYRKDRFHLHELLWAALFGFLLEWITLKQLHAYHYGQFLIMIDDAPLCIGLGWAVIIYSSMEFSNRIHLPDHARPILDALLALNIDLAFDVIAIRLGMWRWNGVALNQDWFGVPWANLWAWFIVVWSFSTFIRALRAWQDDPVRRWLYPPLAMLLALACVIVSNEFYRVMATSLTGGFLPSLLLVGGSVVMIISLQPHILQVERTESGTPFVWATPFAFHAFGAMAGIGAGIFSQQPIIGGVAAVMLFIGLSCHTALWWVGRSLPVNLSD